MMCIKHSHKFLFRSWCFLLMMSMSHVIASNVVRVSLSDLQGDGMKVYQRILQLHESALASGQDTWVVYPRGAKVRITIPEGATPIPLTSHTDFGGCTFLVENTSVDGLFLFSLDRRSDLQDNETVDFDVLSKASRRLNIDGGLVDSGDFSSVPVLAHGRKLLYVFDSKLWSKRNGKLSIFRRDIIHIVDGKAQNKPIQPYSNASGMFCFYDDVTEASSPVFERLTLSRMSSSTRRTYLLKACGQVGLQIKDICINTPEEDTTVASRPAYVDDMCLYVRHSVNTLLENIRINGTYSAEHQHGYGMRLINLANTTLRNVQGDGPWGVQCGFYLNTVTLDGCVLNRFDCHCYCADFTYRNCIFRTDMTRYSSESCSCQVSCAYGYMHFAHCRFVDARPIIIGSSYSGAFSGFELLYQDCVFDVLPRYYYLVEGLRFDNTENSRSLPNLYMRDCILNVSKGTDAGRYYLFHFNNQKDEDLYADTVNYLGIVSLENVQIVPNGENVPIWFCNKKLKYHKNVLRRVVNCICDSIEYPSR